MCMFCRSLFVILFFFFWPLCCLFFFDLRILITPLMYSNSSGLILITCSARQCKPESEKFQFAVQKSCIYYKKKSCFSLLGNLIRLLLSLFVPLLFLLTDIFKSFDFSIFSTIKNAITETRGAHLTRYLRFYYRSSSTRYKRLLWWTGNWNNIR